MSREVISVLALEGRYIIGTSERTRARDNYDVGPASDIKMISPSQINVITWLLHIALPLSGFKYGKHRETRSECVFI